MGDEYGMADRNLTDNAVYDALHGASEKLRPLIDRAETRAGRTALEAACKALDLLALGVVRAQVARED